MKRLRALPFVAAVLALNLLVVDGAAAQMAAYDTQDASALTAKPGLTQHASFVPEVGSLAVQAGIGIQTHVEKLGFNIGGWYQLLEQIGAGVIFTYYFLEDVPGASQSAFSLDFLGRYAVYEMDDGLTIFVIGGINFLSWKFDYDACDDFFGFDCDWSVSDLGLNAGGMLIYPLGGIDLFALTSLILGSSGGFNVQAGASLNL